MTRDLERPLPFWSAARRVFDLALEGMIWSRRSLLMAILLGLPVAFALLYRVLLVSQGSPGTSPDDLYGYIVALYSIRNVVPLAALFYATSLVADEVEGKTLTYLLARPIPRPAILAGKFAAYLATTVSLALPATVATFFVLATAPGSEGVAARVADLLRDTGVIALALVAYGALFTLLGVVLRRPVIPGLLFLFVWELTANLPGYMPRLTLTAYLRSLVRHRLAADGFLGMPVEVLPAPLCFAVLASAALVFLAAALWIFSTREYVLES
jgi:ABC-type transport system involved in multi-copper enzyme maturation permease subunit